MNSNTGLLVLGLVLLAYGLFCVVVGVSKKPGAIWTMAKIEGFKKILGEVGTQIFISVWGLIALGFGVWLTFLFE